MQVVDPASEVRDPLASTSAPRSIAKTARSAGAQQEGARAVRSEPRTALLRASLICLDAHEHVLLLVMHHSIVDGWSVGILLEEAGRLYDACRGGQSTPLPELPVQYADYAIWQRRWLQGESPRRQVDYWKQQLTGLDSPRADTGSAAAVGADIQRLVRNVRPVESLSRVSAG